MSEVRIFENPGNKAARLERENAQLRAENKRLRDALGEAHVMVPQMVSGAPEIAQDANSFTMPGGATVTIGRKPGGNRPSAIPSLQQTPAQTSQDGATTVQIYNSAAAEADLAKQVAQAVRPAARAPQRMVNGQPAAGGGGGMAEFNLGAMQSVPVKPRPPAPAPAPTPLVNEPLDEARQRFELLELDVEPDQQQTGTGTK